LGKLGFDNQIKVRQSRSRIKQRESTKRLGQQADRKTTEVGTFPKTIEPLLRLLYQFS